MQVFCNRYQCENLWPINAFFFCFIFAVLEKEQNKLIIKASTTDQHRLILLDLIGPVSVHTFLSLGLIIERAAVSPPSSFIFVFSLIHQGLLKN